MMGCGSMGGGDGGFDGPGLEIGEEEGEKEELVMVRKFRAKTGSMNSSTQVWVALVHCLSAYVWRAVVMSTVLMREPLINNLTEQGVGDALILYHTRSGLR